jgi:hypothetical protein
MAARLGRSKQGLQQFVSQSPWPAEVLLEGLVRRETRRAAPAYGIIDLDELSQGGPALRRGGPPILRRPGQAGQPSGRPTPPSPLAPGLPGSIQPCPCQTW